MEHSALPIRENFLISGNYSRRHAVESDLRRPGRFDLAINYYRQLTLRIFYRRRFPLPFLLQRLKITLRRSIDVSARRCPPSTRLVYNPPRIFLLQLLS